MGRASQARLVLLLLMAVKFCTVAYFFMHLRFDKPILTRLFYSGLVLAIGVYLRADVDAPRLPGRSALTP